jgi:regulator of nucleoside diphosphate kinase
MSRATPSSSRGKSRRQPPVVLDAARVDLLQSLAAGVSRRDPDLGERLMEEIARATVVPSEKMPADVVTLGSEVSFRDETTGRVQTITLVAPGQADIAAGRASVVTPIGAALLGLRTGAEIDWRTRDGETRRLRILSVAAPARTQP